MPMSLSSQPLPLRTFIKISQRPSTPPVLDEARISPHTWKLVAEKRPKQRNWLRFTPIAMMHDRVSICMNGQVETRGAGLLGQRYQVTRKCLQQQTLRVHDSAPAAASHRFDAAVPIALAESSTSNLLWAETVEAAAFVSRPTIPQEEQHCLSPSC